MSRFHCFFAVGLVLAGTSQLRAGDLDRILARDRIAAGKLLSDASSALRESVSLEKTSPAMAALLLEKSIAEMKDATVLAADERSAWLGKLQGRLRSVNETLRIAKVAAEQRAVREAEEAIRKMRDSAPRKGAGVSDTAKRYVGSVSDQIAAAERFRRDGTVARNSIFRDVEVSATPINGFVEYPKYWARIVDSPHRGAENKLHPKEVALLKTLNSTMSVDFDNHKFSEVIEYLQQKTGLTIFVNKLSLEEAGIEYDDPVTFKVPKVTVRTVLKKILADRNLTYIIKEGSLQVMTPMRARDMMVVRAYYVRDLLGPPPNLGPFVDRAIQQNTAELLIKQIQTVIEPGIWEVNGGTASIVYHAPTASILVRAPAEMHYMLGGGGMFR